jgi:hypothetical protein
VSCYNHYEASAKAESDGDGRPAWREDRPTDAGDILCQERVYHHASDLVPIVNTLMSRLFSLLVVAAFLVLGLGLSDGSGMARRLDVEAPSVVVTAVPSGRTGDGCLVLAELCGSDFLCSTSHAPTVTVAESLVGWPRPDNGARGLIQHDNLMPSFILECDPPVPRAVV